MADLRVTPGAGVPNVAPVRFPQLERTPEPFTSALGRAMTGLQEMQAQAKEATAAVTSGQSVDTAQAVAQIEKASIAFQYALSIRNKLLEAYQDVMRMPV